MLFLINDKLTINDMKRKYINLLNSAISISHSAQVYIGESWGMANGERWGMANRAISCRRGKSNKMFIP